MDEVERKSVMLDVLYEDKDVLVVVKQNQKMIYLEL